MLLHQTSCGNLQSLWLLNVPYLKPLQNVSDILLSTEIIQAFAVKRAPIDVDQALSVAISEKTNLARDVFTEARVSNDVKERVLLHCDVLNSRDHSRPSPGRMSLIEEVATHSYRSSQTARSLHAQL